MRGHRIKVLRHVVFHTSGNYTVLFMCETLPYMKAYYFFTNLLLDGIAHGNFAHNTTVSQT